MSKQGDQKHSLYTQSKSVEQKIEHIVVADYDQTDGTEAYIFTNLRVDSGGLDILNIYQLLFLSQLRKMQV